MSKIFGVYFRNWPDQNGKFFDIAVEKDDYDTMYCLAAEFLQQYGIKTVILTPNTYIGAGKFLSYYSPNQHNFTKHEEVIKPDIILDKGAVTFNDGFLNVFNSAEFTQLGRNKYSQSEVTKDFSPKTILVSRKEEVSEALAKIKTERVVVKPLDGYGGNGVIITDKSQVSIENFPVIMQEFIESESGVNGLVNGRHDVRLIILDGEIVLGAVRQPAEGSFLANVHQGGSYREMKVEEVPASLLEFAKPICEIYDRLGGIFYSIDFMFDGNKWYLIEMNEMPGLPDLTVKENRSAKYFFEKLAVFLQK